MNTIKTLIFIKGLFCLFITPVFSNDKVSQYKEQWGYKSISCQLNQMASVEIKGSKIKSSHKKEKAKLKTIFTDLDTDKPRMVYPDNIGLIKLKEMGQTYWLLSPAGRFATAIFIVNTSEKWFVQQKTMVLPGQGLFYSWAGKCE